MRTTMTSCRWLAATLAFVIALGAMRIADAEGTFIPAPNRRDMAYDATRHVLYISAGSDVLRYSLDTAQFLSPYHLGENLLGMDISPDDNTLAVADLADVTDPNGTNRIFLVDLRTGTSQTVTFPLAFYEGGTFTVAFGSDGAVLVSSTFLGSGSVPLRRYDPATRRTTIITPYINQSTMLTPSADRRIIAFAEANESDGPWGRYRVSDGNLVQRSGYTDGTSAFNYEIGTNRDGSQFAIPTYVGAYIYDSNYSRIATIGAYGGRPIGLAYHPNANVVFFPWAGSREVRVYDTTTLNQIGSYDFQYTFSQSVNGSFDAGRAKVARDGSLLFVSVGNGVRYVPLLPSAGSFAASIRQDTSNNVIDTPGHIMNFSGPVTVTITTPPTHGRATVNADNTISYTPDPGYHGADSIAYDASDGASTDSGYIAITVANFRANDDHYTILLSSCCSANLRVLDNDFGFTDPVTLTIKAQPDHSGSLYIYGSPGAKNGVSIDYYHYGGAGNDYTEKFTYEITDGTLTDTATVSVHLVKFIAQDDAAVTNMGTPVTIGVGANDLGFSNPAVVGIFQSPLHGSAVASTSPDAPGLLTVTYVPEAGFKGTDSFQYAIEDGTNLGFATVTVEVISDLDLDGLDDDIDNCSAVANPDQRDSDHNGYGNVCDGDFNHDGVVNFADLAIFRQRFASSDADADLDGSGYVNFADLAILRHLFGRSPGPSGLHPQP